MKITKTQLRQIIKEEVENTLDELQGDSQAQQAMAQKASLVKAIGMNIRDLEKMAKKIYMQTGEESYHTNRPHGQVLASTLEKQLEKKGFDEPRIKAVFKYLENFSTDRGVRHALTKEMSDLK